jgi:hypothetical protein
MEAIIPATGVSQERRRDPEDGGDDAVLRVDWNLHGKRFTHGTWLCIEFNKSDDAPCAKILR